MTCAIAVEVSIFVEPGSADAVAGAVRGVLSRYVTSDSVLMPAAVWIVQASNG